jgi:hypothetical protein
MHSGGRCQARDVVGEGCGWQIDQIAALWEADGPPGPPVHGNCIIGWNPADRLRGLPCIEMASAKVRPPTSHWYQRDIDMSHIWISEFRTGIAGIPTPQRALDEVAERRSAIRASGVSPTVVIGCQDAYS